MIYRCAKKALAQGSLDDDDNSRLRMFVALLTIAALPSDMRYFEGTGSKYFSADSRKFHEDRLLLPAMRTHLALSRTVKPFAKLKLARRSPISSEKREFMRIRFTSRKRNMAILEPPEIRELRQLREENTKLKKLVADISLDRQMLQEIVTKTL